MTLKEFIKQNKFFFAITVLFLTWIGILITFSLLFTRQVDFYNYLADEYVTDRYSANIPLLRYLIEPIVGIAFYLTLESAALPLTVFMGYIIYRILYGYLRITDKIKSKKFNLLNNMGRDMMLFVGKLSIIVIGSLLGYYLIALSLVGGKYASYGMFYFLELVIWGGILAFGVKLGYLMYKYYHPSLKFNYQKRIEKWRRKNKFLRITQKEVIYCFGFVFLFASTTVVLKMSLFPTFEIIPDKMEEGEILIDFHSHTTESDGFLTPEERVMWYIQHGIHAAAISDHDTLEGSLKAQRFVEENDLDLNLIIAQEYSAYDNHLNIYGLEERIIPIEYAYEGGPTALNITEMVDYVKEKGGYVTVNHYNREEDRTPYSLEDYYEMGVDGFEIINKQDLQTENIREFCLEKGLIALSGSDIHYNHELYSFVRLKLNDPGNYSLENIFESLRKNEHETVLIENNPERVSFEGFLSDFEEFENFSNYLLNLDSFQYLSWILWTLGIYLVMTLIYLRIKNLKVKKLENKIL
ncbi:MAG: PHP domain-containing protein [Promethearchaeia archaeon]